jgi:hypothetical protein
MDDEFALFESELAQLESAAPVAAPETETVL